MGKMRAGLTLALLLLVIACFLCEVEAKNKAGKMVKNAAKAYTAHKAARTGASVFKILFLVIAVVAGIIGIVACAFFVKRRLRGSESEGFGLLHNGP